MTTNKNNTSKRWVIVSNRLPLNFDPATKKVTKSAGGLVTAISGIKAKSDILWVGAAPGNLDKKSFDPDWGQVEKGLSFHPVFLGGETYSKFYNGMCNNVLWPLLHYETHFAHFKFDEWEAYKEVNKKFAQELKKVLKAGDIVWIHDFHLFLLPTLYFQL